MVLRQKTLPQPFPHRCSIPILLRANHAVFLRTWPVGCCARNTGFSLTKTVAVVLRTLAAILALPFFSSWWCSLGLFSETLLPS